MSKNNKTFREKLQDKIKGDLSLSHNREGKSYTIQINGNSLTIEDGVNLLADEIIAHSNSKECLPEQRERYVRFLSNELGIEYDSLIEALPVNLINNRIVVTYILVNFPEQTQAQKILAACRRVNALVFVDK